MCGILGILDVGGGPPLSRDAFGSALALLKHRGPDEGGTYFAKNIALGVRRLAIVDVAGGHQPVASEDGTIRAIHNGEIYNHAELRKELEAAGHQFQSHSDAEVLPHGFEVWGFEGLLERLRGMFAFAIWNERDRSLFIARDRMGMKPLYYMEQNGRLYFASEIRPILLAANPDRHIDIDALALYLRLGYTPAPRTLYAGIRKLPAAHCLCFRDGRLESRSYWRLSYAPAPHRRMPEATAALRQRLKKAVASHLMSDVPIGALLSGGIDSATVVSLMREVTPQGFPVVTLGFDVEGYDETERASACASALGLKPHHSHFPLDLMDGYPAVLQSLEEPLTRSTFMAAFHIFRACRELGLKVVMTGEGADELLGGYAWHWNKPVRSGLWNHWPSLLGAVSRGRHPWLEGIIECARQWEEGGRTRTADIVHWYLSRTAAGPKAMALPLLAPDLRDAVSKRPTNELLAPWFRWVAEAGHRDPFQQILWLQSRTRLPDVTCMILDKMGMAHSIECRPPFLDQDIWEYCAGLPRRFKVRGYFPNQCEKFLLREAGRGLVPDIVRTAPKRRLRVPVHEWLARPRLSEWAEDALSERTLRNAGLFDPAAVAQLRLSARTSGRIPNNLLMSVLALQTWLRTSDCTL